MSTRRDGEEIEGYGDKHHDDNSKDEERGDEMIAMIIMVTDVDASKSQRHNILRVWCFACFVLFVCNRK